MNAPLAPRPNVSGSSSDFEEETRETWQRVEGTLSVIMAAQLELSGRVAKLESPASIAQHGQAVYPPPYQGPERRHEMQPSYTTETIVHLRAETDAQTPILRSMAPQVETNTRRMNYALIAIVIQMLTTLGYAITHQQQPIPPLSQQQQH